MIPEDKKEPRDTNKCIRDAVDQFNRQHEKQNVVVVFARKMESPEPGKRDPPADKKVKVPETPKNPDCDPATRGYAKRIGRVIFSNMQHRHHNDGWAVMFMLSLAATIVTGVNLLLVKLDTTTFNMGSLFFFTMAIMTIASFFGVISESGVTWKNRDIPRSLNKWEPPIPKAPRCQ
jgi:hypothetical protein